MAEVKVTDIQSTQPNPTSKVLGIKNDAFSIFDLDSLLSTGPFLESKDYPDLQTAINAAQSQEKTLYVTGHHWVESTVTVHAGVEVILSKSALIETEKDIDLFIIKPTCSFRGGQIRTWTYDKTFTSNIFVMEVGDTQPVGRASKPTIIETQAHGEYGANTGTVLRLKGNVGQSGWIYGLHATLAFEGYSYGVHASLETFNGSQWINGNKFKLYAGETERLVYLDTKGSAEHIDANDFEIDYQCGYGYTDYVIHCDGRYNRFRGMIWDWVVEPEKYSIKTTLNTTFNSFDLGGVDPSHVDDKGQTNQFRYFTANRGPGFSLPRFYKNKTGYLYFEDMNLVVNNMKTFAGMNAAGNQVKHICRVHSADLRQFYGSDNNVQLSLSDSSIPGTTAMSLLIDGKQMRVVAGPADSAGTGYRYLRIPNS